MAERKRRSDRATEEAIVRKYYRGRYPEGLDLAPGSDLHDMIVSEVMERADEASEYLSSRHSRWQSIDETLTTYIAEDDLDKKNTDIRSSSPVSIIIPESYGILETLTTYMVSTFSSGPLFRYHGIGPEDEVGAILLGMVVEQQTKRSKALLDLYVQWKDAFTYGFGVVHAGWRTEYRRRSFAEPRVATDAMGQQSIIGYNRRISEVVSFEGTKLTPISPYRYLPDPAVNIWEPQKGGYVGWKERTNYINLLGEEQDGILFNVRTLDGEDCLSSIYDAIDTGSTVDAERIILGTSKTQPVDLINMYITVIPSEWGLGNGDLPEKWFFSVAGDHTLVAAYPLAEHHGMFPVAVCAPDMLGHQTLPISRLEMISGLQTLENYYINSHIWNIISTLKTRIVADPKSINMDDLERADFGGVIKTRRAFWGRGVKDLVQQLPIADVTSNNYALLGAAQKLGRETIGIVDALQGVQRQHGERVTAVEFSQTRGSALSRLQKAASLISLQSMYDLGDFYASNTQQFMSEEVTLRIMGEWEERLRGEFGITDQFQTAGPNDIIIGYDVDISDSSQSGGEFAESWVQLAQMISASPEALQVMDFPRIILHIARIMGARNAQDFIRKMPMPNVQTMPDEAVAAGAAEGNYVPMEEAQ